MKVSRYVALFLSTFMAVALFMAIPSSAESMGYFPQYCTVCSKAVPSKCATRADATSAYAETYVSHGEDSDKVEKAYVSLKTWYYSSNPNNYQNITDRDTLTNNVGIWHVMVDFSLAGYNVLGTESYHEATTSCLGAGKPYQKWLADGYQPLSLEEEVVVR